MYTPTQYGQIVYFTLLLNKAAAVVKKISVDPAHSEAESNPIIPVQVTTDLEIIDIELILEKVIYIDTSSMPYIVRFPCPLKID
jgi:hypothetical protein